MNRGTYVLHCAVDASSPIPIEFGAAGERILAPGRYAYVGSAQGPGGFARIYRHREIASGERDTRNWHIDYFLGHEAGQFVEADRVPERACECALARVLEGDPVSGIGASDCGCETHLFSVPNAATVEAAVEQFRSRRRQ